MSKLYKVLVDGKSCHGGEFKWSLPRGRRPGAWTPKVKVSMYESGYHLTSDPLRWLKVGCKIYEAKGRGEMVPSGNKIAYESASLIRECPKMIPAWWRDVERFIDSLKSIPWMKQTASVRPEWKVFDTPHQAWSAAQDAAGFTAGVMARFAAWERGWNANRDLASDAACEAAACEAAGNAAKDAALMARCLVASDLISPKHLEHAKARMDVWRRGYGLACDVGGVLYVYRKNA